MTTSLMPPGVREARPEDVADIVAMVRELADYEKAVDQARMTSVQLYEALFGADPPAHALVAQSGEGRVVGFALWYRTFSTWDGVPGIHLEDLYVRPTRRGSGIGRGLLVALARIATERGYSRVEWDVLRWNSPAIRFYESLEAVPQEEWLAYRLTGKTIGRLAES
ncbi:N-acetyltransferase family protein [Aeromicrobium sp.]|uniref:GNAT family N-acetyltransferase n=1 Tax=Aeromicrobium sp. TaxID=1871063 RepID=UPI0035186486